MTTREKLLAGGDSGEVVALGKGTESLLFQMLSKSHETHMPPKKQLSDAQRVLRQVRTDFLAARFEQQSAHVDLAQLRASDLKGDLK